MGVREVVRLFPAKTVETEAEGRRLGISVLEHGLLTARVWLELRRVMGLESVIPEEGALLAAAHDVGKMNPLFLKKLLDSLPAESTEVKHWSDVLRGFPTDLKEVPHPCVSRIAVADESMRAIGEVVERHHGYEPADVEDKFPASAGVFLEHGIEQGKEQEVPRICGGVSLLLTEITEDRLSSPHLRGCFRGHGLGRIRDFPFPADAGVFGSKIFGCRYESYCLMGEFYGFLVSYFNFDYPW